MDDDVRARMETAFSADFSGVRIHTAAPANAIAHQVGARALTTGSHVLFGPGKYGPGTPAGDHLLAHELAHVVQQRAGAVTNPIDQGPHDPLEHTANAAADRAVSVGSAPRSPATKGPAAPAVGTSTSGPLLRDADDDLAEYIAKDLANYVAQNRLPYAHVLNVFTRLDSDIQDNVAADFVEGQPDTTLEEFAKNPQGLAVLDAMSEAMLTGHVTSFETRQAERILHAKAGSLSTGAYRTKVEEIAALRHRAEDSGPDRTIDEMALSVAGKLADLAARQQYAEIRKAIADVDSDFEDNVASHFVALQTPSGLVGIARDPNGRTVLHFAYEAIITGSVSAWERMQAERILTALAAADVPSAADLKRLESPLVFALDSAWGSTATIRAELLTDGQLKVWYDSSIGIHDKQFEQERNTLTRRFGSDALTHGMIMSPDEVVVVKLYNQRGAIDVVPAIKLIDYFNQQKEDTLGKIKTVSIMAATLGVGGVGGAGVLGWADTISFAISAGSLFVNAYRDDISKTPFGRAFLKAWDVAEGISNYYGWARLGIDGIRLVHAKVRPAYENWAGESTSGLNAAEQSVIAQAKGKAADWLDAVEKAESAEAAKYLESHPPKHVEGAPGNRHADIEGGHRIEELPGGAGCEMHSPGGIKVPCTALDNAEAAEAGTARSESEVAAAEAAKAEKRGQVQLQVEELRAESAQLHAKSARAREVIREAQSELTTAQGVRRQELTAQIERNRASLDRWERRQTEIRAQVNRLRQEAEILSIPENSGGAYRKVNAKTSQGKSAAHHIPPKEAYVGVIGLTEAEGPSIWVTHEDHVKTESFGNKPGAESFRQTQRELIAQGRFVEAFERDVESLRKAGLYEKYERGILQARMYMKSIDPAKFLPRTSVPAR
jgi:hypothetical protein